MKILLLILFLGISCILILLAHLVWKKWSNEDLCFFLGIAAGVLISITIGLSIELGIERSRFKVEVAEYENLKKQLDEAKNKEVNLFLSMKRDVLEMNNKIDKNRILSKSVWRGAYYNSELGDCEKLEF
jgi:hypothetical protein